MKTEWMDEYIYDICNDIETKLLLIDSARINSSVDYFLF